MSKYVRIVPNSGWSSYSFSEENKKRLQRKILQGNEVCVLYYGDYDPSGLRMVKNLKRDLDEIEIKFVHVAITKEQIAEFGLDHLKNPDPDVKKKLENDKNSAEFRRSNNGELFQIEVDARDALDPDNLKRLLRYQKQIPILQTKIRLKGNNRNSKE